MSKDAVKSPEDIRQMLDPGTFVVHNISRRKAQTAGEDLLARDYVGRPVERMAAVIDSAAGFWRFVNGA
ncbi:hypothetical protein V498_09988 [Pseudogymnoascus sp. VKM F-4517 (FW-2822)]|nr:hypothetical protein V498_09988 [Pseudogymnoascus sp. VKM F-4517 (FW-2822)]